jgi:hypothetical protein
VQAPEGAVQGSLRSPLPGGVRQAAERTDTFYSWDVAADGTVIGRYWGPGSFPPDPPSQNLGPLHWKQPTDCGA